MAATVVFVVNSVNDAPRGLALNVSLPSAHATSGASSIEIILESHDVDDADPGSMTYDPSFSDTAFTKLTAWPRFGDVFQVAELGEGALIPERSNSLLVSAVSTSYASEVVRFSSQWSVCGEECKTWANPSCNKWWGNELKNSMSVPPFSEPVEKWGDGSCEATDWDASSLLHEPDGISTPPTHNTTTTTTTITITPAVASATTTNARLPLSGELP